MDLNRDSKFKNWQIRLLLLAGFILFLFILIFYRAGVILTSDSGPAESEKNICHVRSPFLKGLLCNIYYSRGKFWIEPERSGISLRTLGGIPRFLSEGRTVPLSAGEDIILGEMAYKFQSMSGIRPETSLCDLRVEDFIRTGTASPFYIALNKGPCRGRDLIILPDTPGLLSALGAASGESIRPGFRLAALLPPLPENEFLPHQDAGYRLQPFYDGILALERGTRKIPIRVGRTYEIKDDDVLNVVDQIRLGLSLEKRLITETVQPDSWERRLFSPGSSMHISCTNRNKYGVFFKVTGLREQNETDSDLLPSAWLEEVEENRESGKRARIPLSTSRANLLVTPESDISFFRPNGFIPDRYSDIQTIELSKSMAAQGKIGLKGPLIELSPDTARRQNRIEEEVRTWNRRVRPAGVLFWGELPTGSEETIWLTSHVSRSDSAERPRNRNASQVPALWQWSDTRPNTRPGGTFSGAMKPVVERKELAPSKIAGSPPPGVEAGWIWDSLPWNPLDNPEGTRYLTCRFKTGSGGGSGKSPLNWNMLCPASGVSAHLNGRPLVFERAVLPPGVFPLWRVEVDPSLLLINKENLLALELGISPIPLSGLEDRPGIQVRVCLGDNLIESGSSNWEVSVTRYLDWYQERPGRGDQWLSRRFIRTEKGNSRERRLLHPEGVLGEIPVMWLDEEGNASRGKRIRYFRHPLPPGRLPEKANLTLRASGPVTAYLNGRKFLDRVSRVDDFNLKPYLTEGRNFLYLSVEHLGQDFPDLSQKGSFQLIGDKLIGLKEQSLRHENRFRRRKPRGPILDRDGYSLPRLLVLKAAGGTLRAGDLLPLTNTMDTEGLSAKDILLVEESVSPKSFTLFSLPVSKGEKGDRIDVLWRQGVTPVVLRNMIKKDSPAWLYAPDPLVFAPPAPAKFSDRPMLPGRQSGGERWQSFFPGFGKERPFRFDREHLLYRPAGSPKIRELFYSKARTHFRTGQIVILDPTNRSTHELETDQFSECKSDEPYPVAALRLLHVKGESWIVNMGPSDGEPIFLDSREVPPGQSAVLKNGQRIGFGPYVFLAEISGRGILAQDLGEENQRHYPPGLGLAHTVGHYYQGWHGLESLFDRVLGGRGEITLTLDDDLTRIARDEVQRELQLIERKQSYKIAALRETMEREKDCISLERLKRQMDLMRGFQPEGAMIVLNRHGEILAAVSEPSPGAEKDDLERAYGIAESDPGESPLINRAIHEPKWSPGSSIKVLTAAAALETKKDNHFVEDFLSIGSTYRGECRYFGAGTGNLAGLKLPNGRAITTDLSNHNAHDILQGMHDLTGAMAKSYNVYFGYLGLLMNRTVMFDSNAMTNPRTFWWRVFADRIDRERDFPLLGLAERMGYNRHLNLMPGRKDRGTLRLLPEPTAFTALVSVPGIFPTSVIGQTSVTRTAIGQGRVRTTPLLNALTALTVACRGRLPNPTLIREVKARRGNHFNTIYRFRPAERPVFSSRTAETIASGMHQVVNGRKTGLAAIGVSENWSPCSLPGTRQGTATSTFDDCSFKGLVFGKTGTSEGGEGGMEGNSWFIAYIIPHGKETFALAAVFPGAGMGNRHAGECVKRMLERMRRYYGWDIQ